MPRPGSTNHQSKGKKNVEYIVRGSSPLYSALSVLTFVLIAIAIAFQYFELTVDHGFPTGIFF
jgi:hypothetical protein